MISSRICQILLCLIVINTASSDILCTTACYADSPSTSAEEHPTLANPMPSSFSKWEKDIRISSKGDMWFLGGSGSSLGEVDRITHYSSDGLFISKAELLAKDYDFSFFTALSTCKDGDVVATGSLGTYADRKKIRPVLVKYDTRGKMQWLIFLHPPANSLFHPCSIESDTAGDIVITGIREMREESQEYLDLREPGTLAEEGLFAAKVDIRGNLRWVKQYDPNKCWRCEFAGMGADSSQNIYVACRSNLRTVSLVKYSPNGQRLWTLQSPSNVEDSNNLLTDGLLAVRDQGGFYLAYAVVGRKRGLVSLVVNDFDAAGTRRWSNSQSLPPNCEAFLVSAVLGKDDSMYVLVSCVFQAKDGQMQSAYNETKHRITKISPDGTRQWTTPIWYSWGRHAEVMRYLVLDDAGNTFAIGSDDMHPIVVKCSASGSIEWTKNLEDASDLAFLLAETYRTHHFLRIGSNH